MGRSSRERNRKTAEGSIDGISELTASADIFAKRFEQEIKAGRLTRTPSAKVRGRLLVDLLQGVQLRAKVGITREQLLEDARSYVPLILGK